MNFHHDNPVYFMIVLVGATGSLSVVFALAHNLDRLPIAYIRHSTLAISLPYIGYHFIPTLS